MMYPRGPLADRLEEEPELKTEVGEALKSFSAEDMMREGMVYGGGLRKVEPKDLGRASTGRLGELLGPWYPRSH